MTMSSDRRIHRNDVENIPAFLAVGLLFVAINPPLYLRDGIANGNKWIGSVMRLAAARISRATVARIGSALPGRRPGELARELMAISGRGVTSCFVFSRGDTGLEYFQLCGEPWLRGAMRDRIQHRVVNGAGHTFSPPAAQRALREILVDFVARLT